MKQLHAKKPLSKAASFITDHFMGGRFSTTYRLSAFLSILIAATAGAARGEGVTPEESAGWDGNVPDGGALIDSGEHVFNSGLNIGGTANSEPLRISGGKVTVTAGDVKIANYIHQSNAKGELVVDGTGEFEALSSNVYLPSDPNGTGRLTVAGQGVAHIKQLTNNLDNRVGYLTLSDQGRLTIDSDTAVAQGGSGGVVFNISTSDQSYFKSPKFQFGDNGAGVVHATFNGGTIDASDKEWIAKSGKGSTFVFGGATATIGYLSIEGYAAQDFTNTVEIASGSVSIGSARVRTASGLNSMLLVSGGQVSLGELKVGQNSASAAGDVGAIYRQTAGVVEVTTWPTELCDAAGSNGSFEMLGGTFRSKQIRAGAKSSYRSGTGSASFRINGGTVAPFVGNLYLFETLPSVKLGEDGLTIDTEGRNNVRIVAQFEDDVDPESGDPVDGKFVKIGNSELIVEFTEKNDGNVAEAFRGRCLNSDHALTVVKKGSIKFQNQHSGTGFSRFGRTVRIEDGAMLDLTGSGVTKLKVDNLALGNGQGLNYSSIKLDSGDVIEVAVSLDADAGAIDASWINGDGEYPIFTCANGVTVDQAALDSIVLLNPPSGKDYIWVTSVDEVTGVTSCKIKVGDEGTLGSHSSIVYTDGVGVVDPDGSTDPVGSISGYGSAQDNLNLHRVASATVAENKTLTLGGALKGDGRTTLTKTGPGKLAITGDNSASYNGGFAVDGGILSIEDKSALGPVGLLTKNLTLKSGTLAFESGDTSGVNPITLTIATGTAQKPAIVDVAADATLTAQNVVHQSGALVKTGAGELSLDLGEGDFMVVKNNNHENSSNPITLPESGDSPLNTDTLSALNVLEGTLRISGDGAENTTVKANDPVLIGGNYAGNSAPSLVLEDVTFSTEGKHISFGRKVPTGGHASELHMTNAVMRTNKLEIGHDGSVDSLEFVIDLKDSTIVDNYKLQLGSGAAKANVYADNSAIECSGSSGLHIGGIVTAVFTGENAKLASTMSNASKDNEGRILVYDQDFTEGTCMRFENGASLVATRGLRFQNSNTSKGYLSVVFDGGAYRILAASENNCRSRMAQPQNQGFTVENGGLEIDIAENVNHYITFPIRGTGDVVKTGAGTLYLTESYNLDSASTEKLLQYTGGTTVSNGTLVVDGSLVADGAKSFEVAEGAILDLNETTLAGATISGSGVVTNGTLSAATIAYDEDALPTFSDVSFSGTLFVDFGCTAENPLDRNAGKAGITVAHYTGDAPVIAKVVPANTGIARAKAKVVCDAGDIVVTVEQSGLAVVIR